MTTNIGTAPCPDCGATLYAAGGTTPEWALEIHREVCPQTFPGGDCGASCSPQHGSHAVLRWDEGGPSGGRGVTLC